MAGNVREWSTETHTISPNSCTARGGSYYGNYDYTDGRYNSSTDDYGNYVGFRTILYL